MICVILLITLGYHVQAQAPLRNKMLITEIFIDPNPSAGLPAAEFVELCNLSDSSVNIFNWKLMVGNSNALIRTHLFLEPGEYLILCSNAAASEYSKYGKCLGLSTFPSLPNESGVLSLHDADNNMVHAIAYQDSWYRNPVKKEGGWSLEMIDTSNPCGQDLNWKASANSNGGSPGHPNSVRDLNPDQLSPQLIRSYTIDKKTIMLIFDEPLDSMSAANLNYYLLPGILQIANVSALPPMFMQVKIEVDEPVPTVPQVLRVENLCDCMGNKISRNSSVRFGMPVSAAKNAVIFNELLFNPKPGNVDYIELLNRSESIIDLSKTYLATKATTGVYSNIQPIADEQFLLFPNDYLAITTDTVLVKQEYLPPMIARFLQGSKLVAMPDDRGSLILLNEMNEPVDEIDYDRKWHFPLINNDEGVALERIDPNRFSSGKEYWTSASHSANYGTPGYQNSQFRMDLQVKGTIGFVQKIVSPDNDGMDDQAQISYEMEEPGHMLTLIIYNRNGKPVRKLAANLLLGIQGKLYWDGLDDKRQQLPVGIYIMVAEIFNMSGRRKKYFESITLARKT